MYPMVNSISFCLLFQLAGQLVPTSSPKASALHFPIPQLTTVLSLDRDEVTPRRSHKFEFNSADLPTWLPGPRQ